MVTPDKRGGTPSKYGNGEKRRARSAGYKLAGDVIDESKSFQSKQDWSLLRQKDPTPKERTHAVLGRALGVSAKVLPIKPDDK